MIASIVFAALLVRDVDAQVSGPDGQACTDPRLPTIVVQADNWQPTKPLPILTLRSPSTLILRLAIARDLDDLELGLRCVAGIRPMSGELFVLPGPESTNEMWMRYTLIPLDIVFVAADGVVTSVASAVPAASFETAYAAIPRRRGRAKFVIELRAGDAGVAAVRAGSRFNIPASIAANN